MSDALDRWRELVLTRRVQMDAAYARQRRGNADFWDRRADRFRAQGLRLAPDDLGLTLVRRLTTPESSVLDVGAGAGRYSRAIAPFVRRVTAVEPNGALLGHLRADAAADGITNIDVVEARWEDAEAPQADLGLCAHVLYPLAEAGPFIQKLAGHARSACVVMAMAEWREPPLMLELWQRFHGEPRIGQPDARHVFDVLYALGVAPNVEMSASPLGGAMWRFASLEEAVAVCREHLILPANSDTDRELTAALTGALTPLPEGGWVLPNPPRLLAGLWWLVDSPRLNSPAA